MGSKARFRAASIAILVLSVVVVGYAYASTTSDSVDSHLGPDEPADPSEEIVPPREDVTVITTDSNTVPGVDPRGPRSRSQIVAFDPDGRLLYHNESHTRYWDVDPVPGTETTVEYVYSDHVDGPECEAANASQHAVDPEVWASYERSMDSGDACSRNGIERVNLTTGDVTPVWSRTTPGTVGKTYHDADRINETHVVVADIYLDRAYVANVTSDEIVWTWNAIDDFPADSGGPYPEDWTHVNDVEVLPDGRFMLSLRNHDQVVFVDPETGLEEEWTLGTDDDYDVLYEQHNPDYIPEEDGGPAIVVADSENARVQEFQREGGEWNRTWEWSDRRMQWPRDADRLPNGNTLVADSNGDRVFEVDRSGTIVWSVDVAFPYEVERLGTGDESRDGPSADRVGVTGDTSSEGVLSVLPTAGEKYLNAALYVTPVWMGLPELAAVVLGSLATVGWLVVEATWLLRARR